ncbi:MAG TPA: hypothetical protein VFC21_06970 [Bryobacteraceae bacterium]|nr:hypothetical protein [Bryobacteraceae bacterium]
MNAIRKARAENGSKAVEGDAGLKIRGFDYGRNLRSGLCEEGDADKRDSWQRLQVTAKHWVYCMPGTGLAYSIGKVPAAIWLFSFYSGFSPAYPPDRFFFSFS